MVGIVAAVYWVFEGAYPNYVSARRLLVENPRMCVQLADRAIMKAGGDYPKAQLLQCQALAATGEWDAALGGFTLIRSPSRCSSAELLDLAEKALAARQMQLADLVIQAARVPGLDFSRATEMLVSLKLQRNLRDDALELCREWQMAAPNDALPWAVAAEVEMTQFDLAAAIADYQAALKRSPDSVLELSIRVSLAKLLVHTGNVAAARLQFDRLLQVGPVARDVRLSYVQLLRMEGRFDDALTEAQRHIDDVGKEPEALKQRAMVEVDQGRLKEALVDLKASITGNEFDIAAHHLIAQVYLRQGEAELAQPHLDRSRRMTEATFRISELHDILRTEPNNAELRRELKELNAIVGH